MFDIGGPELLLIILGIIVLFGPKKIPEAARIIGKGIQKVRDAQSQFKEQIDEIQNEIKSVNLPDEDKHANPPINEIDASDLTAENFYPSYGNTINEPYKLSEPEKDDEQAKGILDGSSHGFQG